MRGVGWIGEKGRGIKEMKSSVDSERGTTTSKPEGRESSPSFGDDESDSMGT